ncbi:MAG: saeR 1 [Herbinix sp.]|nr:saeR 1 [Herbinix sp.]
MSYRLLLVDDELQGYGIMLANNGLEAVEKAEFSPDLILLDIQMPGMDGLEVCKRIRSHITCPILFLTAKVTDQDKINGLMIGGDDYIVKPFHIDELGARVAAHLRREARNSKKEVIKFLGKLTLNFQERCVYKERIYEKLWGYDSEGDSNIITEHIRRVRMKLSKFTDQSLIETVWGVGYKWIG